jgi:hypothetical protein
MAKRLHMTNADYLAIAISPALIMALVGSLVFFLIEVLYVGQYELRLNYAFALFVFATVLISRIAIEMGSERAVLFGLPLGAVMYLFMIKFVEHPGPMSHVINLALLGLVWWCAHKLTWDSTVIDDDEDASGEGLLQRLGVGEIESAKSNELLRSAEASQKPRWWQRLNPMRGGPHTPGTWVLYFSLAALPLFGVGQHWIPASDVGRRRYAFGLLVVYVAAAFALLVSTSFLNLRRYLRQRRIEMPLPIAGTWVGVGAALIVLVMLLAALIPRPNAEIALSQVPWQAGSPSDRKASRTSFLPDGGEKPGEHETSKAGTTAGEEGQPGEQPADGQPESGGETGEDGKTGEAKTSDGEGQSEGGSSSGQSAEGQSSGSEEGQQNGQQKTGQSEGGKPSSNKSESGERPTDGQSENQGNAPSQASQPVKMEEAQSQGQQAEATRTESPPSPPESSFRTSLPSVGGLSGVFKLLFYLIGLIAIVYGVWRYHRLIMQAIAKLLRQLRELFGGKRVSRETAEVDAVDAAVRRPSFGEFRDPFLSGQHGRFSPEELVRYTFAAFEAWAGDRGLPRTPDCTPQELVNSAVEPKTAIHTEAGRMVRLYGQVAYASQRVTREAAAELRELWQLMRNTHSNSPGEPISR